MSTAELSPPSTLTSISNDSALSITGNKDHWYNLIDAGLGLAVAEAATAFDGVTVLLTGSAKEAAQLENELAFFAPEGLPVLHFADWETLPYDLFSPHQDITSARLATLSKLPETSKGILVVPVTTLMHRIAPTHYISGRAFHYRTGDRLDVGELRQQLEKAGYLCVDTVYEHGEFAVRGALIDIFPMGAHTPFRIDLFDDEIETLRSFDPETQRTLEQTDTIALLPAREIPLDKTAIKHFQSTWHQHFDVDHRRCPAYQDVSDGIAPQGIEYYLPLFFEQTATLLDYLPENCQFFSAGNTFDSAQRFWHEIQERYTEYGIDPERPLLPPAEVFVPVEQLFASLGNFAHCTLHSDSSDGQQSGKKEARENAAATFGFEALPALAINARSASPLASLQQFLNGASSNKVNPLRILLCAETAGRRETLLELLGRIDVHPEPVESWQAFVQTDIPVAITVNPLDRGLLLPPARLCLISESDLFGQQVMQKRRRDQQKQDSDLIVKNLTELRIGAPVVHIDHGVGRYQGLEMIAAGGETQEFLTLHYANDAKLYVPVASLHLISRYSGSEEELAPLHRLGSEQWQKAKDKALRQIRDSAAELLDVYAQREAKKGFACALHNDDYAAFCADFPFEETPDQLDTIAAVKKDMLSDKPMDRLVCGDVGFGKTEVAMRAAFIAVSSGKQVIMLVPTTLLAHQHAENFRDRFANWPVRIEELSRFRSAKEQSTILDQAADGKIDILIGTHKLLNSSIHYRDLGLLIIDEEHRFGVRQKDKIKALRTEVDILTLTATPIPRTLNLSMSGVRDLSIIATPPARRLSVKTFVRQHDDRVVREAILREILRGGQVYFLHNEVKTIEKVARELAELVPEARIGIGHGQMRERELEKVMSDFYHQRFNTLVCTTIIETGIDIPSANTIIINRADNFGLAQLHQLRGRVGRSHHQAYAYLLTPHHKSMTNDAVKRLEAIKAADHLGSGFTLATHDLEIRGAGELLGENQSGHIQSIGFTLYMELLDKAVHAIRSGKTVELETSLQNDIDINLNLPALIPDDYLPDVNTRLTLYKRIANAGSDDELRELQVEMIDRFGLLPEPVKNLFRVTEIKLQARALGITRLETGPVGGRVEFSNDTVVEPITLIELIQKHPQEYRLQGASGLRFTATMDTVEQRLQTTQALLESLTP